MKVKVVSPYQVVHEGKTYTEGDTVDAPEAEANEWLTAGYVEETKSDSKAQSSSSNKAQQSSSNKSK